jgi:hypothetical protein
MSTISDYLAPDEDDYEDIPQTTEAVLSQAGNRPPIFGEEGFGKGKSNPRKGSPRARITERDIPIVYFLGHFPGADVETCSIISTAKEMTFGDKKVGGGLTSVATTRTRLDKLRRLGVVDWYRNPLTGDHSYGLTPVGLAALVSIGLPMDHGRTLRGLSVSRLPHYRAIALVAAKFASPAGYFKRAGIDPVPLEKLVSENAMRAAYEPVKAELKAEKEAGRSHDFGKWRAEKKDEVMALVTENKLSRTEILDAYPVLLTLGQPQGNGVIAKPVHQPDMVVNLDSDREAYAKSILIEVERTPKSHDEYRRILATFAAELKSRDIAARVFYFTLGTQVQTILKKIDADEGHKLFETGRLVVVPLTDKDGKKLTHAARITIGGN